METYRVIFRGKIAAGMSPHQVREGLAKIFSLNLSIHADKQKLSKLLSGKAVVVKAGLQLDQAQKYQQIISQTGAMTDIEADPDGFFFAPGEKERRIEQRRKLGDRRSVHRSSSILPDRRKSAGRRKSDPRPE